MRYVVGLLFLALVFSGCEKAEKVWTVNFETVQTDNSSVVYRVRYRTPDGVEKQEGPITDEDWKSSSLSYEDGKSVFLEIEIIQGSGAFDLRILREGALHHSDRLTSGAKTKRITTSI